jgi:hypothetical protein
VIWDDLSGFGLRIYPTEKKAFILSYRHNGRKWLITIGQYGVLTLDQARREAKKYMVDLIQKNDPLEAREKERVGNTIKQLCESYIDRHAVKKKSAKDDIRRIEKHILPAWGSLKASVLKRADIATLHAKIGKNNGEYEANRSWLCCLKCLNWLAYGGLLRKGKVDPNVQTNNHQV